MEEDIIEETNKKLDSFYKETGIWPPGRSMPSAMCGGEDKTQIQARAYQLWVDKNKRIAELEEKNIKAINVIQSLLEHFDPYTIQAESIENNAIEFLKKTRKNNGY